MDTLTEIKEGRIVTPVPIQIMFGGCPVDPDAVDLFDVFGPHARWDAPAIDEMLEARCSSL